MPQSSVPAPMSYNQASLGGADRPRSCGDLDPADLAAPAAGAKRRCAATSHEGSREGIQSPRGVMFAMQSTAAGPASGQKAERGFSVYGAMWATALISAAFTAGTVRHAVDQALAVIPASSRLARTVRRVASLHDTRMTWEDTLTTVAEETAGLGWIHPIPNAAVLTAVLLYGDGDFTRTITLTVRGGLDGSVAGVLTGAEAIPDQWMVPLEDRVRSAVFRFDGVHISELAERTVRLAGAEA